MLEKQQDFSTDIIFLEFPLSKKNRVMKGKTNTQAIESL